MRARTTARSRWRGVPITSSATSVLALDTATPYVTVAVADDGVVISEESIAPEPGGRPRAATALMPAVGRAVERAGGWGRVERIGVGVGPGSFTGLRIGVATARALAQGLGKPLSPVVSLRALALGVGERESHRARLALIDARRGQVFAALYDADGRELRPPFVAGPDEAAAGIGGLAAAPLAVGDGSIRFRQTFEAAGAEVPPDGDDAHRLWARNVCALAGSTGAMRLEAVEPIYLRPPDAELWRERQRPTDGD
jgi:tRNA threonylcarbamoyladenosine biosynthesis protein TsaB